MSAEIKAIHGGRKPGEPIEAVVADLERLLDRARSGELVGLVYGTVHRDGSQATGWSGDAGTGDALGTSIMMLGHRYAAQMLTRGPA